MAVTLVIGTEKGAFVARSDDARRDWRLDGPLYKGWKVTAAGRTAGGSWLLATASHVYGAAIHAGRDLLSLKQVAGTPRYDESQNRPLSQIWKLAVAPDACYAAVMDAGLFRSRDDGAHWQPIAALNDHPSRSRWQPGNGGLCAHSIVVDPANPQRIWCGISAVGVWRSDDGGASWIPKNAGVPCALEDKEVPGIGYCVHALQCDPDNADTLWRQDHLGMFRSRDAGDSWERIENGLPSRFGFPLGRAAADKSLFVLPLESDEYRIPKDGRLCVYRSRDGGDSWQAVPNGLPQQNTYCGVLRGALDADTLNPAGVYFGTTSGEIFFSRNAGDEWSALPYRLPRILCVNAFVE